MGDIPHILLVDDDEMLLSLGREGLKEYKIQTANSFLEAKEKLAQCDFDLLISDINLPDGSGLELVEKHNPQKVPVIFISGTATEATQSYIQKLQPIALLLKPFPMAKLRDTVAEALAKEKAGARKELGSVLVADDHEETRSFLANLLRGRGYEVSEACNGKEAVEQVIARAFDVVLMDIHMPEMGGIQAIEKIKQERPTTFVVVMTGEATKEEIKQALKEKPGHDGVLRKPFTAHEFTLMVKHLREESAQYQKEVAEAERLRQASLPVKGMHLAAEKRSVLKERLSQPKIKQWIFVVLFSIFAGLGAYYSLEPFQRSVHGMRQEIGQFFQRVEGYLYRDEQRELKRENR